MAFSDVSAFRVMLTPIIWDPERPRGIESGPEAYRLSYGIQSGPEAYRLSYGIESGPEAYRLSYGIQSGL
jgi:hypothetical protein